MNSDIVWNHDLGQAEMAEKVSCPICGGYGWLGDPQEVCNFCGGHGIVWKSIYSKWVRKIKHKIGISEFKMEE